LIDRCPTCERELLLLIDEDGRWWVCPNYMCDFAIEDDYEEGDEEE